MNRLQALLFSTGTYERLADKERASTVYAISIGLFVLVIVLSFILVNDAGLNLWAQAQTEPAIAVPMVLFYILNLGSYFLTRLGYRNLGAISLVFTWMMSFGAGTALTGGYTSLFGMVIIVTVLLSALLLRFPGLILSIALTLVLIGGSLAIRPHVAPPNFENSAIGQLVPELFVLLVAAALVWRYLRISNLSREETLLEAMADRLALSQITSRITQRISSRMELDEALNEAVDYIVGNYPEIYHAQIFLVDAAGAKAFLEASTGEAGRQLLGQKHNLSVGSQSVIGEVTSTSRPVIARARSIGTVHRPNEYLPNTRVEAAFPLRIGETIIGALDLQSTHDDAFPESDLPIFQTLADHIAIAVDNARLFQETQQQLATNAELAEQARQNLRQVEQMNRRLTAQAWSEYLGHNQSMTGLDIDLLSGDYQPNANWTPAMQTAATEAGSVEQLVDGQRVLVVPVRVRGEIIGVMEFELDAEGQLSAEDRQLAQDVTERFGLAAENARLFDESQRSAQREALINEAGSRLQTTTNVENTMTEAARSLQQMLKAGRVSIRLGEPPVTNGNGKGEAV